MNPALILITDTDTDTDTTPVTSYLLDDATDISVAFSVRKLSKNHNNPILKVQRGGDNLQRYFGEIGGSNSDYTWFAYDDPDNGLAAWLNGQPGYIIWWWRQDTDKIGTVYGGRVFPNTLGKYPTIWFNGQSSRIQLDYQDVSNTNWRSAHLIVKEDSSGAPEDGQIISRITRGANRAWVENDRNTVELLSGVNKIGGEVVDLTTTPIPTTWEVCSLKSNGFHECDAIGCLGLWGAGTDFTGAPSGRKFHVSAFWRGEIAEIILVNNISVDLDAYYASAKEAFGLT